MEVGEVQRVVSLWGEYGGGERGGRRKLREVIGDVWEDPPTEVSRRGRGSDVYE